MIKSASGSVSFEIGLTIHFGGGGDVKTDLVFFSILQEWSDNSKTKRLSLLTPNL